MTEPYRFKDLRLYWDWQSLPKNRPPDPVELEEKLFLTYGVLLDDLTYPEWRGGQGSIQLELSEVPDRILENIRAAADLIRQQLPGGRPVMLPRGVVTPPTLHIREIHYEIRASDEAETGSYWVRTIHLVEQLPLGPDIHVRSGGGPSQLGGCENAIRDLCSSGDAFFREYALSRLLKEHTGGPNMLTNFEPRVPWVFISYRDVPEDREFAGKLASAIDETLVLKAWYFPWESRLGDSIPGNIEMGMLRCSAGVIVYSPDYFEGPWADHEYQRLITDKVKGRKTVIGVLPSGDPEELPLPVDVHLYVDFGPPNEFDDAFQKLYRGLLGKPLEDRPRHT